MFGAETDIEVYDGIDGRLDVDGTGGGAVQIDGRMRIFLQAIEHLDACINHGLANYFCVFGNIFCQPVHAQGFSVAFRRASCDFSAYKYAFVYQRVYLFGLSDSVSIDSYFCNSVINDGRALYSSLKYCRRSISSSFALLSITWIRSLQ